MSERSEAVARGIIVGYRRGSARQYNNQVLIQLFVDPKQVHSFVGSKVVAADRHGNVYRGRIVRVHSESKCVVVARFEPNIPGQLIGSLVDVFSKK
ncbi:MAG: 50S ribosomal protein L35ae [Crenarchaeota archaeon]|nr:50S ribosomal protein L35ae [Thermoproteota archaeon]